MNLRLLSLFALIALATALPPNPLWGQCFPFPQICNANQCGYPNVNLAISVVGNNVVCDGAAAAIAVDESQSLDFDEFEIYWCDWVVETFTFATQPVTHVYNIPDSLLCDASQNSYFVHVIGRKYCGGDTLTCRTAATSMTVNYRPQALFSVSDLCIDTPVQFSNESCNEEEYLWNFGDGNFSTDPSPSHLYGAAGSYTVRLIVSNSCGSDTTQRTFRVVEPPEADFVADPAFSCGPDTVRLTNRSNQWSNTRWEIANDTLSWSFADSAAALSDYHLGLYLQQYEAYIVTLIAFNACGRDSLIDTVHIYPYPAVSLSIPDTSCDSMVVSAASLNLSYGGEITDFEWVFENGTPATATGDDFGEVVFYQSGSVRLRVFSPCDTFDRVVPITVASSEPVAFIDPPAVLCQSDEPLTLAAQPGGGTWSGLGAAAGLIAADGTLNPADFEPGHHAFAYLSPETEDCPTTSATIELEILPALSAAIAPPDTACESLLYTPAVVYGGGIATYAWSFPGGQPAASALANPPAIAYNTPGTYLAAVSVEGFCGTAADTVTIVVQENLAISIEPAPPLLCTSTPPFQLEASAGGGTWLGEGISDAAEGIFDPSLAGPGQTVVSYEVGYGACLAAASLAIDIISAADLAFPADTFCIDSEPRLLEVNPQNGTFAGPGVDSITGLFDPSEAGVDLAVIGYTFTDENNCVINSTTLVLVEERPVLTLSNSLVLCLSDFTADLPQLAGYGALPGGGTSTWSGPGIENPDGLFNPALDDLDIGTYTIHVSYERHDCRVQDSLIVELVAPEALALSPDALACISDDTFQLGASLPGGTWSGPGIAADGLIDLHLAGGNQIHTYVYDYLPGTSCGQTGSVQVEIIDLAPLVNAGPDTMLCQGPAVFQLSGATPAGQGYWDGHGLLDSVSGLLDLSVFAPDEVYVFDFCLESQALPGCRACDSREFILHSNPEAGFELEGTACRGEAFNIQNNSGGADQYAWDFGDGTLSSLPQPSHQYDQEGDFTIRLIATQTATGCRDTAAFEVFVTVPPQPAFTLAEDEGCAPFPLMIDDQSSGYDISLVWQIDGETYPGAPPSGIVLDSITEQTVFIVRLEATNLCGTRSLEAPVLVRPYPIVRFGIFPDEGCSPLTVALANTTLGEPQSFLWDFGNGQPNSTELLPPFPVYTTADTLVSVYTISLVAANDCGIDTLTKEIVVYPPDVRAFIEADTLSGCQPLTVNLQSYSTPGAIITWVAHDEQGNQQGGNAESLQMTFERPGLHTVILYASRCGTDTDTVHIEVLPAPTASFDHRLLVCAGQPLAFSNTSQNISASFWDFGDGNTSSERSPEHVFQAPGTYTVTLTVYSQLDNCPHSVSSTVEVSGNPVAAFTPSATNGCSPLSISFENASSGGVHYVWDFGDGSSASFAPSPTHVFEQPGNYVVRLTVYDADSCFSASSVLNIFVFPDPVAQFALDAPSYCLGNDTLRPLNQSEDAIAYEWSWQGQVFTSAAPVIVPQAAGAFPLQLVVWNTFQCRDTFVRQAEILPSPIAGFAPSASEGCQPLPVQFANISQHADNYAWSFGDGNGSAAAAPGHVFLQAGTFEASLIALAGNGCPADTLRQTIAVWPKPHADFAMDQPDTCGTPVRVWFESRSSADVSQSDWRFGDGGISSMANPSHVYQQPGVYEVELIVATARLCRDTTRQTIDIFGQPRAAFVAAPRIGCQPLEVAFLNQSTQAQSFHWEIEPHGWLDAHSPTLRFDEPGAYGVRLIAVYNERCQDTLALPAHIRVYESPQAAFSYRAAQDENVLGDVEFINASQNADRYFWDFGDGTASTEEHPYHEYDINRDVEVLLVAYNDNGGAFVCTDSLRQPIEPEWITTFYAPNALAPEYGEGGVEVFRPVGIGLARYEIAVFSSWGDQVWHSTALEEGRPAESWNGAKHNQGPLLPQGTYVWRADVVFVSGIRKLYSGNVTLLR